MKDLEFFITSIKQFITGTANNLKTILDKKFKGVGLVEVSTETIRTAGDINIKLKNIPKQTLVGNPTANLAAPSSLGIGGALKFSDSKLGTDAGSANDITDATTGQKSWSGATLKEYMQPKIGFARFSQSLPSAEGLINVELSLSFNKGISFEFDNEASYQRIKILETGYYEVSAGFTTIFRNNVGYYVDIFYPAQDGDFGRASNGGTGWSGGATVSTGVIYVQSGEFIRMTSDLRDTTNIRVLSRMAIKKIG